jgi:hypothetical protein
MSLGIHSKVDYATYEQNPNSFLGFREASPELGYFEGMLDNGIF